MRYTPNTYTKARYPLDTNVDDYSWNGKNGTATNISYWSWRNWGCAICDWTSLISIPLDTFWTIGTWDFTVSFWIWAVAPSDGYYPMIFWSFELAPPFSWPIVFFDPKNANGQWDCVIFRVQTETYITTPSASSLYNKWTHIVYTRISWIAYIYYNAELVWTLSDGAYIWNANGAFILSRNGSQTAPNWFKGDEYILENKWRTTKAVKDYYNFNTWLYNNPIEM